MFSFDYKLIIVIKNIIALIRENKKRIDVRIFLN